MLISSQPAPIGFVKEFLVVANDLTMKSVDVHSGKLIFRPKYNRQRDVNGLMRRLANRLYLTELADASQIFNRYTFNVNQDRLNQLIDLRGWPEVNRNTLCLGISSYSDEEGYLVELELNCEEYDDL